MNGFGEMSNVQYGLGVSVLEYLTGCMVKFKIKGNALCGLGLFCILSISRTMLTKNSFKSIICIITNEGRESGEYAKTRIHIKGL